MKQLTNLVAAGLFLAAGAGNSLADTSGPFITYSPIASTLTDWTSSLGFQQFNSSLGTLTSVEIDLSSSFTTTINVMNNSESGSSGTAQTEVQLTVQDAGLNLNAPELDLVGPTFSYSLGAGGNATSGLLSKSGMDDETYNTAPILAEFTGAGNITLNAYTFTQTLLANTGGNTSASQVTDAGLTGQVIYTFTPAPEPSTFALLALGLGVLPFLRRRRQ